MKKKRLRRIIIYFFMFIYVYIILSTNVNATENKKFIDVNVPSAIVIEEKTGRILYEKNVTEERAMASLTKIMTSIVLVENCGLEEIVEAPKEVAWIGGSVMGLRPNDKVTVKDLLAGMLLPSGNDAAYTAGIYVGGNIDNFTDMMNKKAKEIGANQTSFKNPHGLDADGHYSTAYDLALIMRYALKYDVINEIINSQSIIIKINGYNKQLNNTNALLRTYEYTDGGKTGYTGNAERCLISTATKDNMRVICVVLGALDTDTRFGTAKTLMEESFNRYKMINLTDRLKMEFLIPIIKGKDEFYSIKFEEELTYPLTENEIKDLVLKEDIVSSLKGGDEKGIYLGRIQYFLRDEVIIKKDYILDKNILKKDIDDYLLEILEKIW